jgi:hypothetical protein
MSSEPPPQPVSDTFNYSQWNRDQNLTIAEAAKRYLSKVLNDTAAGIITFLQGIVTNSITPIGVGDTMTVGASTSTLNVNSPTTFSQTVSANTFATTADASALSIASNQTTGHMYIGNSSSRSGSINIGARAFFPSNNTITIGTSSYTTSIAGTVNIGRGSTTNIGTLTSSTVNIATTSGSAINIGSSGTTLSVASAANFTALPTVSASYAGITGGDTSNTIITTNWLNTVWDTYFVTTTNTWSAVQTFSALPLITASYGGITGGDTSNTIITSNWLNSTWLPYLRGLANTWSAVQTFTSSISLSAPINPNYSYPVAAGLIGERVAGVTQSGTTTVVLDAANAQEDIATIDLTRGVWMITTHQTNPNVASSFQLLISAASGTRQNTIGEMLVFGNTNASNLTSINVCGTVSINASATYYAVSRTNNAGGATLTNVFMYAFRIA